NLGYLLLEQLDEQRRIGARQDDLRALCAAVYAFDHRADTIARRIAFGARLLLARQHRLDAPDLEDDVAVLEALDRAAHHLADPLVVFGEDVFALSFADLLEDHLLGRLCGDAPQDLGRFREFHFIPELDAVGDVLAIQLPVHLARFVDRDLGRGTGDVLNDRLEREEVDLTRFQVEPRFQVLAGLVVL